MKVLYDHQIFTLQDYGGISRIYAELLKPNSAQNKYQASLSLVLSNNHYLAELNNIKYHSFFSNKYIPRKTQIMGIINKQNSIREINKQAFDVFHPTYYDPYFIQYLKNKPFVVTFLDMIHERFGNQYPELAQDKKIFNNKKTVLQNANAVIAISESTKKDIIEFFDVEEKKINVIYLATALRKNNNEALVKGNYLLFVGRRERYKNFTLLVKAVEPLLKQYKDLKLVCAGGGAFVDEEKNMIKQLDLEKQVMQFAFSTDDVLTNLYSHAMAFIFPSLYEGFGIPVLEAFACECPIILSNTSSLPEVAANAAAYINPVSEQSIFEVVNKVVHDESYRKELVKLGVERNAFFTWQRNRNETEKLYNQLIQ